MIASPEHAARQARAHEQLPNYGVHGYRWVEDALRLSEPGDAILDYGCGKGTFAEAMADRERTVREYDPGIPGKDALPVPADLVICTDVLPFVERDRLLDTVSHIEALARRALFVAIPYHPLEKMAKAPIKHTVLPPQEWLAMFKRPVRHEMRRKGTPYLVVEWRA